MKVVKHGNWFEPWTAEVVCLTCGAVLLVEEADVRPTFNKYGVFECVCAECEKIVRLESGNIAPRVREAVKKKRKYDD